MYLWKWGLFFCGFITGGGGVPAQHQEEHGEGASPGVASGGDQVDKKVDVFCDDDPGLAGRVSGVNYFAFGIVGVVRKDHLRVLPGMFRALPSQAIKCWLLGVEDRAGMVRGRSREQVEGDNMFGGFVAIMKKMEIGDE